MVMPAHERALAQDGDHIGGRIKLRCGQRDGEAEQHQDADQDDLAPVCKQAECCARFAHR
jgi:hypothetical protein